MDFEPTGRPDDEGGIPFGRYRLTRVLGRGGMGEVFLAVAHGAAGFRRKSVIKRILPELARDEAFVRRFLAEGKLVVQLQHPHIVQVLDMGEESGEIFIEMEYVDGWDLGRIMDAVRADGARMPLPLALLVLLGVAEALAYAHVAAGDDGRPLGLVHRDVSPSNVMVGRQGLVKLLDFGIAAAGRDRGTDGGGGKYAWMAPEQGRGEVATPRSDLFALGIVAWEVLTGAHPFRGYSEAQTTERIQTLVPPRLDTVVPGLPPVLVELVGQLLAKDPGARPVDGYEVVRRLREAAVAVGPLGGLDELGEWLAGLEARTASPWGDLGDFASGAGLGVDELLGLGLGRAMAGGGGRDRTVTALGTLAGGAAGPVGAGAEAEAGAVAPEAVVLSAGAPPLDGAEGVSGVFSLAASVPAVAPDGVGGQLGGSGVVETRRAPLRPWALGLLGLVLLLGVGAFAWAAGGASERNGRADSEVTIASVGADDVPAVAGGTAEDATISGEVSVAMGETVADTATESVEVPAEALDASADVTVPTDSGLVPGPGDPAEPDVAAGDVQDFEVLIAAAPVMHEVRVETDPPGARVVVSGLGSGRSPYSIEAAVGSRVVISASLDGFEGRSAAVTIDGPEIVRFRLMPSAKGEVRFRVLPADAVVSLDGVKVDMGSGGAVVGLSVSVGVHRLSVTAPSGATEERVFEVAAGESKNLRTIVVRHE